MANLAWNNPKNQDLLGDVGVCKVICEVMSRSAEDKELQCEGCRAIDNLAWNHPKNQDRLSETEAAKVVVDAMNLFGRARIVQLQGARYVFARHFFAQHLSMHMFFPPSGLTPETFISLGKVFKCTFPCLKVTIHIVFRFIKKKIGRWRL